MPHYDDMLSVVPDISSSSFHMETTDARILYFYILQLTCSW
jgi:hypothetical protein